MNQHNDPNAQEMFRITGGSRCPSCLKPFDDLDLDLSKPKRVRNVSNTIVVRRVCHHCTAEIDVVFAVAMFLKAGQPV